LPTKSKKNYSKGVILGVTVGLLDIGFELGLPVNGGALGDILGSLDVGFVLGVWMRELHWASPLACQM
jgi:hypothetical protein